MKMNTLPGISSASILMLFALWSPVYAQSEQTSAGTDVKPSLAPETDQSIGDSIGQRLSARLPGINISSIEVSPIPGLYELIVDGQVFYIDESAEYLVDGSLIRLSDRANLTDARQGLIHAALIEQVGEQDMLIYEPEEPSNRSITVFTDISCGYCRRLHAEIDDLLDAGVRVRYLLFPRAGIGSQAHKDLVSVWCAEDPQSAMTTAKAGGKIEPMDCENPVESHVALAQRLGLRGTPLIYTDSGEKIPGYRQASILAEMVNDSKPLVH